MDYWIDGVMKLRSNITGVILAGGKSSRMGTDKAMLELNGKPFIQHITETLKSVFDHVIIISDHGEQYKFLDLPIYEDIYKNCGPLGGIHSAFVNTHSEDIFIVSCDIPFIDILAVQYLLDHYSQSNATMFSIYQQPQPLFGLYNRSCLFKLENLLKQEKYTVLQFLNNIPTNVIQLESSLANTFSANLKNLNTPENYQAIIFKID